MDLRDFIITNGKAAGLDNDRITHIFELVRRTFPGNIQEKDYESSIMDLISRSVAAKQKEENHLKSEEPDIKDMDRE